MQDDLNTYIAHRSASDWSKTTLDSNVASLHRILSWLEKKGAKRWADVTPSILDAYQQELLDRGLAYGTRINHVWLVKGLFEWLTKRGKVLVNPAMDLGSLENGEEPLPPSPLSEEQITQLFDLLPRRDAVDLRTRLHVELLYGCALRLSESLNLDVSDLDLHERTVLVRAGKGNKDRKVPMMRGALSAAKDYLAVRRELLRGPDHGALLLAETGKRLEEKVIGRVLRRLGKKIGAYIHPHLLRHSFAVHLLRRGVDVRIIQEILGHSSLDTTKIYLRLVPGHLREDYDKAMPPIAVGG